MTTKAKSNSIITTQLDESGRITFTVKGAGGANEHGQPTDAQLVLDPAQVAESVRRRAMIHGFIQRVSDKAAISRNTENGQPATPQEKFEAMKGLVDHFMSGSEEWAPTRSGGAGRKPGGLDIIVLQAVAEVTGKDVAAVRGMVEAGAKAKAITQVQFLAALGSSSKVAPVVERMRAEAVADLDGDELLEGLGE